MTLTRYGFEALAVDDSEAFAHVGLWADLREIVKRARLPFWVAAEGSADATWSRALLYNLTFWNAAEPADVLNEPRVPADVVMHVAWHHLARVHLGSGPARPKVEALFLGEAIASAFDLYLVGRLLDRPGPSEFLETKVTALAEVAAEAGMAEDEFEALLARTAKDPDGAFESLRELLFDATLALFGSRDALEASGRLEHLRCHPHHALLHHYELSNWVLYARAYGDPSECERSREVDQVLRVRGAGALEWLAHTWVYKSFDAH